MARSTKVWSPPKLRPTRNRFGVAASFGRYLDLSGWTTMYVGFSLSDESFARFDITLQWQDGQATECAAPGPPAVALDPRAYGYTNDGNGISCGFPFKMPSIVVSTRVTHGPLSSLGGRLVEPETYCWSTTCISRKNERAWRCIKRLVTSWV